VTLSMARETSLFGPHYCCTLLWLSFLVVVLDRDQICDRITGPYLTLYNGPFHAQTTRGRHPDAAQGFT
jgi:hypothetical protein